MNKDNKKLIGRTHGYYYAMSGGVFVSCPFSDPVVKKSWKKGWKQGQRVRQALIKEAFGRIPKAFMCELMCEPLRIAIDYQSLGRSFLDFSELMLR